MQEGRLAEQPCESVCYAVIRNDSGSVEHYYHFLLGYLLPLCAYLLQRSEVSAILLARGCGPLNRLIHELEIPGLLLCDRQSHTDFPRLFRGGIPLTHADIMGLDVGHDYDMEAVARGVLYVRERLGPSIETHCKRLNAEWQNSPRVLVVERCEPDPYYFSCLAEIKDGGTTRRKIANHAELLARLTAEFGQIRNATLETLGLAGQIALFQTADVVVAQHGAALSNIVWMRPGAHVFELIHAPQMKRIFGDLSSIFGVSHHFIEQSDPRGHVDVQELIECVSGKLSYGK